MEAKESLFTKGQSKRIWNELYKVRKADSIDEIYVVSRVLCNQLQSSFSVILILLEFQVIDSSDVVIQVS